jgi:PleD family two-component response regulator
MTVDRPPRVSFGIPVFNEMQTIQEVLFRVQAVALGDSPESLLHRADQHLYSSKQSGRNRVSL